MGARGVRNVSSQNLHPSRRQTNRRKCWEGSPKWGLKYAPPDYGSLRIIAASSHLSWSLSLSFFIPSHSTEMGSSDAYNRQTHTHILILGGVGGTLTYKIRFDSRFEFQYPRMRSESIVCKWDDLLAWSRMTCNQLSYLRLRATTGCFASFVNCTCRIQLERIKLLSSSQSNWSIWPS